MASRRTLVCRPGGKHRHRLIQDSLRAVVQDEGMKIHSFSPILHPPQRRLAKELFIGGSGAVAGGCAGAMVGSELGREYGSGLVRDLIPQAWSWVQQGRISPATALRSYQSLMNPATQAQIGAIGLGALGAVVGGVLALSLLRSQENEH